MISAIPNGILPLFAIIILGFTAVRIKLLGINAAHVLHRFVYYFAFPALLFISLSKAKVTTILNGPFMLAFIGSMLIIYALTYLIAHVFMSKEELYDPMRACCAAFPNAGYIGIPFLYVVFGEKGLVPAALANVLTMIPAILTLFLLDLKQSQTESSWFALQKALLHTARNPSVIAPILGILYSATGLSIPKSVNLFFVQLGNAAIPCALFAIGLNLKIGNFMTRPRAYTTLMAMKLLVHPLVTLALMLWLQVDRLWAVSGFLVSALPTGVLISIIANQYKTYETQSNALIFLTTALSILTLSVAILTIPIFWA